MSECEANIGNPINMARVSRVASELMTSVLLKTSTPSAVESKSNVSMFSPARFQSVQRKSAPFCSASNQSLSPSPSSFPVSIFCFEMFQCLGFFFTFTLTRQVPTRRFDLRRMTSIVPFGLSPKSNQVSPVTDLFHPIVTLECCIESQKQNLSFFSPVVNRNHLKFSRTRYLDQGR
jgi:hypothetical protein